MRVPSATDIVPGQTLGRGALQLKTRGLEEDMGIRGGGGRGGQTRGGGSNARWRQGGGVCPRDPYYPSLSLYVYKYTHTHT